MNIPKTTEEWLQFSRDFSSDEKSAIVLGAIGGGQFDVPLAACAGGAFPASVCIAALIRNLAKSLNVSYLDVISEVADILNTVESENNPDDL